MPNTAKDLRPLFIWYHLFLSVWCPFATPPIYVHSNKYSIKSDKTFVMVVVVVIGLLHCISGDRHTEKKVLDASHESQKSTKSHPGLQVMIIPLLLGLLLKHGLHTQEHSGNWVCKLSSWMKKQRSACLSKKDYVIVNSRWIIWEARKKTGGTT